MSTLRPRIPFVRPSSTSMGDADDDMASLSNANFGYAGFPHMLQDEELAALRITIPRALVLPLWS